MRSKRYATNEVVLASVKNFDVVKRIRGHQLIGDNRVVSTDYVLDKDVLIRGRLVWPRII